MDIAKKLRKKNKLSADEHDKEEPFDFTEHDRHKFTILSHITTKEFIKMQYVFENYEKEKMDKISVALLHQILLIVYHSNDGIALSVQAKPINHYKRQH